MELLENLNLESNDINFKETSLSLTNLIKNSKNLKYLNLSKKMLFNWNISLDINNTILELFLDDNYLKDPDGISIFEGLKSNSKIRKISLCKNEFTDQILLTIGDCLNFNKTLTHIYLLCNRFIIRMDIQDVIKRKNIRILI